MKGTADKALIAQTSSAVNRAQRGHAPKDECCHLLPLYCQCVLLLVQTGAHSLARLHAGPVPDLPTPPNG